MSNETATAIERGSSALNKHPLFGCTCCTWPDQYDDEHPDGCPREDGYTDHDYGDTCWRSQSWSAILTADVLSAALDVEEMARALFESVAENRGWEARSERIREYWRDYARAIRTTLLGGAS